MGNVINTEALLQQTRGGVLVPSLRRPAACAAGRQQPRRTAARSGPPRACGAGALGQLLGAAIPTGSAFTFVAAWPTTRAELVLNNGEPVGGKTYLIDRVWMVNITSMAAAQPVALLGQVVPAALAVALATDNAAILRWSLSGYKKTYPGNARLALANTAFALTNLWTTLGQGVVPSPTTNLGVSLEAFVQGRYQVPPGAAFCLAGLAGTAAGTAILGVEWHEVQLPTPPQ